MTCRYDPEQEKRQSALVVGLCLGAALLVVAIGMVYRGEKKERILPPPVQCWDAVTLKPCEDLRPPEPRAVRSKR